MSESASKNATLHSVGENQFQERPNCVNFNDFSENEGKQKPCNQMPITKEGK